MSVSNECMKVGKLVRWDHARVLLRIDFIQQRLFVRSLYIIIVPYVQYLRLGSRPGVVVKWSAVSHSIHAIQDFDELHNMYGG
jgi:hypothetical protein